MDLVQGNFTFKGTPEEILAIARLLGFKLPTTAVTVPVKIVTPKKVKTQKKQRKTSTFLRWTNAEDTALINNISLSAKQLKKMDVFKGRSVAAIGSHKSHLLNNDKNCLTKDTLKLAEELGILSEGRKVFSNISQ